MSLQNHKKILFNTNVTEYEVDDSWKKNFSKDFLEYRRRFESLITEKPADAGMFPLCIEIESTYHCNLKCPFCARSSNIDDKEVKHMPLQVWKKIKTEISDNYLPSIMMDHEGESLLNPELESMMSDAKDAGVLDIFLHTNGQALTERRSLSLIESGLTKLNVSIDAATEDTYKIVRPGGSDLNLVKKNLETFLRIKKEVGRDDIRVRVSFVNTKDNIFERENFFNQWKDKVNTITFQNMIDMSVFTNQQEQSIFIDNCKSRGVRVDDFLCDHLWGIPIIDVDGNIIPCGMPVRDFTKDFILGNINDGDTIKDVWSSDKFNKLRNIHKNGNIENINICNGCAYSQHNSKIELSSIIMDDL